MQHESNGTVELDRTADEPLSSQIARNCLLTRARQISRVLTSVYDDALRPFGIVAPQFSLLVLIAEFGPISRSDLGRRNHHERSTLTRNLQPLIAQGYMSLGMLRNPYQPQSKIDVGAARQMIDILTLLKEKTEGNLTADEEDFLETHLGELKLAYVQRTKSL